MTKLEWCKANAAPAMLEQSDEFILEMLGPTYDKLVSQGLIEGEVSVVASAPKKEVNPENKVFDYMVEVIANEFGNNVAFKGGYILTKLLPDCARQTEDIDFSIQDGTMYERVKEVLEYLAEHFRGQGVIDRYEVKEKIAPTMLGGITMYRPDGSKIGVDVGWHDVSWGVDRVTLNNGEVMAFSVERMLTDKILAMCTRKRFRRVKDLYDVFILTECFDFDASVIALYVNNRTDGKGAEWQNLPFSDTVISELGKAYNKLNVRSIYLDTVIEKPLYIDVINRFNAIAERVRVPSDKVKWNHVKKIFE